MELRHLRYFCAVAEHRSFTIAARQLNVSQSGVSGQVRDLEKEIGVKLLRRTPREVALTPEGLAFLDEARDILMRADQAVELALRVSKGRSGKLTVGLCGPVTASFLPQVIRTFRKQYPGVALAVRERAPSEQVDALLSGQIDIGFARSLPPEVKHLLGHELMFRETVVLALPKAHPFALLKEVSVKQLAQERLIVFSRDGAPDVFDAIVAMCRKAHFSPRIADTPRSWHAVLTMVEANEGVGVIPHCVQHFRGNDIVFRPLADHVCQLQAIVAWRRNEPTFLQDSFLALLRSRLKDGKRNAGRGVGL